MNKRYYEHTLPIIRGSLSNTYVPVHIALMRTIIMNLLKGILAVRIQYDSIETANL